MIGLTLHGSYARVHKEEPIVDLICFARSSRKADPVILGVILLDQVLHDTPRLKQVNSAAVRELVCESGDAAIGIDLEKPVFFLGIVLDVDFVGYVWKAAGVSRLCSNTLASG